MSRTASPRRDTGLPSMYLVTVREVFDVHTRRLQKLRTPGLRRDGILRES